MTIGPAVRAIGLKSRKVRRGEQTPSYTSWLSFFPGERRQWYLMCTAHADNKRVKRLLERLGFSYVRPVETRDHGGNPLPESPGGLADQNLRSAPCPSSR